MLSQPTFFTARICAAQGAQLSIGLWIWRYRGVELATLRLLRQLARVFEINNNTKTFIQSWLPKSRRLIVAELDFELKQISLVSPSIRGRS